MKTFILITSCLLFTHLSIAQVKINRYATSQVSSTGLSGKNSLDKEIIIPEVDIDAIYKKWISQNISKFAEPVDVDISLYELGAWETVESFKIIRLKITAKKASSIAVYFDKLFLSPNAELFIYSADGTVITGPITEKENISSNKMWGSNVFNGTSVILELKTPISEVGSNKLHIQKILYGIDPKIKLQYSNKDSTTGPGFQFSSSCNINVTCITGWEQERRAIAQVVHGNGGWCSAFLIMNTCNTNIPYVLTANHCVVDGNGNPINTSNSTFEFLWFSPTCNPTTNTSSTLLFNGASIQARWEQSDFALLSLNQTIPQNSTLTFLGWSRSTNPPNNSVGIHHPFGDIMKISIENNQASIGSVRNFPNTAWRVVWDQGTVEGGSSGSPLFDMNDHRVVGQLFSNTQPISSPCNQPTGGSNYGRFNVSWEGGGTSSTRLRDWLDPSGSEAMTTNTTNAVSLNPPITSLQITGADNFCGSTSTYSLSVPAGTTVSWQSSNPNIATVSPTGNPVTVTRISDGVTVITATVSSCGEPLTASIQVSVGVPDPVGSLTIDGVDPRTNSICRNSESTLLAYPGVIEQNTTYEWSLPYDWTALQTGTSSASSQDYLLPVYPGSDGVVYVRRLNQCGYSSMYSVLVTFDPYCSNNYTISPNPAKDNVTIDGQKGNKNIKEVQVIDKMGQVRKLVKFGNNVKRVILNVSGLTTNIYYVRIFDGKEWTTQKLSIQ